MNIILFQAHEDTSELSVSDRRARHIREVLRLKEGDSFDVGVVNGPRGSAAIVSVKKGKIDLFCDFSVPQTAQAPLHPVTLICGAVRPAAMKRILKDAAQLGVREIIVCGTDKGEKSYLGSRLWKGAEYKNYLIQGAEQAFSTSIPVLETRPDLEAALSASQEEFRKCALDNYEFSRSISSLEKHDRGYLLVIGSERGWSNRERGLLRDRGFPLYSLGHRVLKTETAVTAAVAIVLHRGELI